MNFQKIKTISTYFIVIALLATVPGIVLTGYCIPVKKMNSTYYLSEIYELKKIAAQKNNSKIINFLEQSETFLKESDNNISPELKKHFFDLAVKYYKFAKKELIEFDVKKTDLINQKNIIKNSSNKFFKQNFFNIETNKRISNYIRKIEFLLKKNDTVNAQKVLKIVKNIYKRQIEHSKTFSLKVRETEESIIKAEDKLAKLIKQTEGYSFKKVNENIYSASEILTKAKDSLTSMKYDKAIEQAKEAFDLCFEADSIFKNTPHYKLKVNMLLNKLINISANLFKNNEINIKYAEAVRNKIFEIQFYSDSGDDQKTSDLCLKMLSITDYYSKAKGLPIDSICKAINNIKIPKSDKIKNSEDLKKTSKNTIVNKTRTSPNKISELIKSKKQQDLNFSKNKKMLEKSVVVSDENQQIMSVIEKTNSLIKNAKSLLNRLEKNSLKMGQNKMSFSKNYEITKGIIKKCQEIRATLKDRALDNFQSKNNSINLSGYIKKIGVMEKYIDFSSGIR